MKILMTCYDIADYGGIALQVEIIAKGLRALGHEVTFVILRCVDRDPYVNKFDTHIQGTYSSVVANQVNAIYGWYGVQVYGYGSQRRVRQWQRFANGFDAVLHQIPVPKPDLHGYWREVYALDVPQMAVVHDIHFPTYYTHLIDVAPHLLAICPTNDAQFNSTHGYPGVRHLVPTAHILTDWDARTPWRKRPPRFVSAHVWKRLKRMDRVLRALPLMKRGVIENVIGGDGIEARYMRSVDKVKEEYRGLWRRALKAGMDYRGLMTHREVIREYMRARVQIDLSYTAKGIKMGYGMAPNRSFFEAINYGCINLLTTESAQGWLFEEGVHLYSVRNDLEPRAFADVIHRVCTMHHDDADTMIAAGRALMKRHWDHRRCAQSYVDVLEGRTPKHAVRTRHGRLTAETTANRNVILAKAES
jgi:glycosyltransferase involved in cell wall biosynthesis